MQLTEFLSGPFSIFTVFYFQIFTYNIFAINCVLQKFAVYVVIPFYGKITWWHEGESQAQTSIMAEPGWLMITSRNQCDLFFVFFSVLIFLIFPLYLKSYHQLLTSPLPYFISLHSTYHHLSCYMFAYKLITFGSL